MSKVRFSVNVPVYNAEKYLRECIDSILKQTFTDFELLLIDDGSTDSSGSICDEYAAKDGRIRVFHNANRGSYATRVFSVNHAQGDYCTFCDADDYYEEGYLDKANELLNEEDSDILVFCLKNIIEGKAQTVAPVWPIQKVFEGEDKKIFYKSMIMSNSLNSLSTKVIRTSLLINDPIDSETYSIVKNGDDFLQSLYPVFNAKKIVYVPECYYNYRKNTESLTHKIDPDIYKSIFAVRSFVWENYLKGTDLLGENAKRDFARRGARAAMKIVKLIAQSENLADEEKIEIFHNIQHHEFYCDFVEPNLVKSDLEKKWLVIYELFSRHSYKLLLSTVRILTKIKK